MRMCRDSSCEDDRDELPTAVSVTDSVVVDERTIETAV
jgi:hypothetical protein